MAFDVGFNFRNTSGFVTDGAGETYSIDADNYPTTRGGATFGEEDELLLYVNRSASDDRRLAGLVLASTVGHRWRCDLPATGDYQIHLAIGDSASGQNQNWLSKDDTTTLDTYSTSTTSGNFRDATNTQYSTANWPGSETAVTRTFASTIFRMQMNSASGGTLNHVRLVQVAAGDAVPVCWAQYRRRRAG